MASFSHPASYFVIICSSTRENHDPNKQKLNNIKINGSSSVATTKVDSLSQMAGMASTFNSVIAVDDIGLANRVIRQNIPTKKQFVDPYRQGLIIEDGVGYRQTVVIRSYEVGPDKTATLESILNLLQVINSICSKKKKTETNSIPHTRQSTKEAFTII